MSTVHTAGPVDDDLADARSALRVRLNEVINGFAGRDDLLLTMIWDTPEVTTPAWFDPARALVTIQGSIALADAHPDDVDPTTPQGREAHPVLVGLCAHEGGHAHSTRWTEAVTEKTPAAVTRTASLLEEPRVEARQLHRRPHDREFLRAASVHLHLARRPVDASALEERWRAAQAAVLLLGRADAGVLAENDVAPVVPLLRDALGAGLLEQLRALWREAIGLDDGDGTGLLDVARRWLAALDIPADTDPESGGTRLPSHGCSGRSAEPGSESADEPVEDGDPLTSAVASTVRQVSASAELMIREAPDDMAADTASEEKARALAAARLRERHDRALADARAREVFTARTPGHGYGRARSSPVAGVRAATLQERAAAHRLTEVLRRAKFRERSTVTVASAVPPGRLDGRAAMFGAAQRALGQPVTAAPFQQRVRRHAEQPPLKVGIAVDVSGSMRWAAPVLSSVAWVVGRAVDQVGGLGATVTFGEAVTGIVAVGRVPAEVTEFVAHDGSEAFVEAVQALDGALRLSENDGARLLVVVSDGHLVGPGQLTEGARQIERLVNRGVRVLHLDVAEGGTAPLPGAVLVRLRAPDGVLAVISDAVRDTLSTVE